MKKLYAILFIVALVHTGVYGQAKNLPLWLFLLMCGVPIMVIHKI